MYVGKYVGKFATNFLGISAVVIFKNYARQ